MKYLKQIVWISLYVLCVVLLLSGIIFFHSRVVVLWKDVTFRQMVLQNIPAETNQIVALRKELSSGRAIMKKISPTVPTEEGLVGVVAAISKAAIDSGIAAQVPVVTSSIVKDKKTEDETSQDLFSDVRIQIVASGDPAALADFLYRVEHLPYILRFAFWKIDTIQQSSVIPFTGITREKPPNSEVVLKSSLNAEVSIVTRKKIIVSEP
ncbi:MAG: hypothetical protein AAB649_02515 [Patescibacteria group bacterium]